MTRDNSVTHVIAKAASTFAQIDILVCFAGIVDAIRALNYTPEAFWRLPGVNTTGM